ncbi:MAG: hypothetical protein U9P11_02930, partial [Pseudomonadota bacterium]|nr:hypothetical protein [Pseudomonadota bacterium]
AHNSERIGTERELTPADAVLEFAMNALRLDQGFTADVFSRATGLPFSATKAPLMAALEHDLLVNDAGLIHTTSKGQRYLNELLQFWLQDLGAHLIDRLLVSDARAG